MSDDLIKSDIKKRLNRIEGQIRGIQNMIDNDEGCNNVLVQISAARAAINKVGGIILENYTKSCIQKAIESNKEIESVTELIDTIIKFTKNYDIK
jgi:CsoR family transcriptional regulator, copper-sensing transcriptional repressor